MRISDWSSDVCSSDLDEGEPELELAELAHAPQVDHREEAHDDQGNHPLRQTRCPTAHDGGGTGDLGAEHHHQHEPVEPTEQEPCPRDRKSVVSGKSVS